MMAAIDDWAAATYTAILGALESLSVARAARLFHTETPTATTQIDEAIAGLGAIEAPPAP